MLFGVSGLNRTLAFAVLVVCLALASCGYNSSSSGSGSTTSGLTFRAFVAQGISSGFTTGSLIIVNANKDVLAPVFGIGAQSGGVGRSPTLLAVTPNKTLTLSYSSGDNVLALISNSQEQSTGTVTLPGATESMVISSDSTSAYVALPTSQVFGQPPGELQVVSLGSGAATTRVPIPAVRYLSQSHNGNRILAFSDNIDTVSVVVPSDIGTSTNPVTTIGGFDRPVAAAFSTDDSTRVRAQLWRRVPWRCRKHSDRGHDNHSTHSGSPRQDSCSGCHHRVSRRDTVVRCRDCSWYALYDRCCSESVGL